MLGKTKTGRNTVNSLHPAESEDASTAVRFVTLPLTTTDFIKIRQRSRGAFLWENPNPDF